MKEDEPSYRRKKTINLQSNSMKKQVRPKAGVGEDIPNLPGIQEQKP